MPRVSRFHLSTANEQEILDQFTLLIASLQKKEDIEQFLSEFLTREEKEMLAKRLVLFLLLSQRTHYTTISGMLRISYETIRNYQNQLPLKSPDFHVLLKRLLAKEKTKLFLKRIEKVFQGLETLVSARTNKKARAKIASGEWF